MALLVGFQRRLIYLPSQAVPPAPQGIEEVEATTEDGLDLAGWYSPAEAGEGLVVMFHGNGGNRADRLPLARALEAEGIGTLLTDYRGYGGNPGSPDEEGLAADARAWERWAREHHDGPIAYLGESLGAGVSVELALERPPAALLLRSPFTSLADVASVHFPFLPVGRFLQDRYEVERGVDRIDAPVVVILGTADTIVPPEQSREVFAAAADPKRLVEVEGANHNDLVLLAGDELVDAIVTALP